MKIVVVLLLLCSCATRPAGISDALVNGRQAEVDEFSARVLARQPVITIEMLDDARKVSRAIVVRVELDGQTAQYGVDRVSDYFMCLLEARERTSTRRLIETPTSDEKCGSEDACEVCNSLTYPLPAELREELRRYWRTRIGASR